MNQNFELKELEKIRYFTCREFDNTNLVINAFTTRFGGVSEPPFENLNISYNVGDREDHIAENRKRILDVLNIDCRNTVSAQQVHKNKIVQVKKEDEGKGALKYSDGIAETDALITDTPGIPLLMCYADCVPIFILDPVQKVIALIHGGRRGTELELTLKTLSKMKETFEINAHFCLAAIFPSIGPCCYCVKEQDKIDGYWLNRDNFMGEEVSKQDKNERRLDLRKANYWQLIRGGLQKKNIFINETCTAGHPEIFFSYRRDKGNTGRMAAIFMLK